METTCSLRLPPGWKMLLKTSLSASVAGKDAFPSPFFRPAGALAPGLVAELLSRPQSQV